MTAVEIGLALLLASMLLLSGMAWRKSRSWFLVSLVVGAHITLAWYAGFIV